MVDAGASDAAVTPGLLLRLSRRRAGAVMLLLVAGVLVVAPVGYDAYPCVGGAKAFDDCLPRPQSMLVASLGLVLGVVALVSGLLVHVRLRRLESPRPDLAHAAMHEFRERLRRKVV